MNRRWPANLLRTSILIALSSLSHAESGRDAWLGYAALEDSARTKYISLPASTVVIGDSLVLHTAQHELVRGLRGMLGRTLREEKIVRQEKAIVLGTMSSLHDIIPNLHPKQELSEDGFWLTTAKVHGNECIVITGTNDRGVLYGAFALLSKIARNESLAALNDQQQPYAPIRWIDQWDNLNGTIERGYAGPSLFFVNDDVRSDLTRAAEYARLLASIGINGCAVTNVNANPRALEENFLPQLARIADVFRPWGVKLSVSVDISSPKLLGGLDTFDPLDPRVADWWRKKVDEIYQQVPDFGGFVVKADSEGRAGPSSYGRTPADAANVIARALKAHNGILFYRAFVYNHHLDWTDPKSDRARAAYDIFHPLDGTFDDNVIVQIKHGPIDFQAREPVSPLFGGLKKTNDAIELQITQEYTGQQRHLCFLPSMWKVMLDFDLRVNDGNTPVKDIIAGKVFHRPLGGFVGVANVGMEENWLAHPLAMANLYGFGRLAWNPNLTTDAIAGEWTRLTFGNDPTVVKTITALLLASWQVYESYTGPLGAQTLTNILGPHYGPGVESSENNGWGQWHRADHEGIGMDRSVATGTGYAGQYPEAVAKVYESLQSTPDELILFFHHLPYTYKLHSGKTVIQHIYDSHYEGADRAREFVEKWKVLKGHIDDERYADVLARLEYQAGHAIVWRDAICNWFLKESGIADTKGRAGHFANRLEAETMQLQGYTSVDVTPWENASGGKAVSCSNRKSCRASFKFDYTAGWYELDVQYFDQDKGQARFRVYVGDQLVDGWIANKHFPSTKIGGDTSTRRWIAGLALRPGDEIRIEGFPDGQVTSALDYVEVRPSPVASRGDR
jgi:alpha-glucuronidase